MSSEFLHYLINQSSGVVIAIMLIWQVGIKLSGIEQSIIELTKSLNKRIK